MCADETAARRQRLNEFFGDAPQRGEIIQVVEHFRTDDQIHLTRQRVRGEIQYAELDVRLIAAARARPLDGYGRDVSCGQMAHSRRQLTREVALRAAQLKRPSDGTGRQNFELPLIFFLLIGRTVVPGILGREIAIPERRSILVVPIRGRCAARRWRRLRRFGARPNQPPRFRGQSREFAEVAVPVRPASRRGQQRLGCKPV